METKNTSEFNKPFFSYIASYIVGSWGLVQFLDWICKRYAFSNLWTDVFGVALLTLIPSALLISWLISSEKNAFSKKAIFFAVNGAVTCLICGLLISFGSNASTTNEVTVLDENGKESKVEVSKQEYIRKVILTPFETDKETAWLSLAVPMMMSVDLMQDKRITSVNPLSTIQSLQKMNYGEGEGLLQNMKTGLANKYFSDYVLSGKIKKIDGKQYAFNLDLLERVTSKSVYTTSGTTSNILGTTDSLTNLIQSYIYESDLKVERKTSTDLAVAEMFTSNMEALKYYFEGFRDTYFGNSQNVTAYMSKAIELDPKFMEAYHIRSWYLSSQGKNEASISDISKALELSSSVSVQQQFNIKDMYYRLNLETEKRYKLLEMWIQLHPENTHPYNELIRASEGYRDLDKTIEITRKAIDAGHKEYFILKMAQLLAADNKEKEAEKYLNLYKESYPDDAEYLLRIGKVYKDLGNIEKSCGYYNEYYTLNPLDFGIHKLLSNCYFNQGDFFNAEKYLQSALPLAKNLTDSLTAFNDLEIHYYDRGQVNKSLELMYERWELGKSLYSDFNFLFLKIDGTSRRYHIGAGKEDVFFKYINEAQVELDKQNVDYGFVSFLEYYFHLEDGEGFNRIYKENKHKMQEMMGATEMYHALEGYSYKFNGEYEKAIEILEKVMENSTDMVAELHLYNAYRLNDECEKAMKGYEKLLKKQPYEGYLLTPYAQCLYELDKVDEAKAVMDKLKIIYENADEEFPLYQEILELSKLMNLND